MGLSLEQDDRLREAEDRRINFGVRLGLAALGGVLAGVAAFAFLSALEAVTAVRDAHSALVFGLPLVGVCLGFGLVRLNPPVSEAAGRGLSASRGDPRAIVPGHYAATVFVSATLAHLFGASVGREGAATQLGASLTQSVVRVVCRRYSLAPTARVREALRVAAVFGVAGGFGAVFGTKLAGAMFALEWTWPRESSVRDLRVASLRRAALDAPGAVLAACVGDGICRRLGAHHSAYPALGWPALSWSACWAWPALAVAVALVVRAFVMALDGFKHGLARAFPGARLLPLRMGVGGLVVLVLRVALGTDAYLGLGVPQILTAFESGPRVTPWAFVWKGVFTVVSVGSGYPGGEVTPLFFMGAALGHSLAAPLGLDAPQAAGMAMVATFSAAAKAPVAVSLMAAELFGAQAFPLALVVGALATRLSGRHAIYRPWIAPDAAPSVPASPRASEGAVVRE